MRDLLFYFLKYLAVAYYSIIYFLITFLVSAFINKYIISSNNFNEKKEDNPYFLFLEILLYFGIIGISLNLILNLTHLIPFPFNKIDKFNIYKLHEYQRGIIIATIFFIFQKKLKIKLDYLITYFKI